MAGTGRGAKSKVKVFESMDARDRWQVETYGSVRNAFRTDEDIEDRRPLLYYPDSVWLNDSERLTYLAAAEVNPRKAGEGGGTYIERLARIAVGQVLRVKSWPRPGRMSQDEWQRRVNALQEQAKAILLTP